MPTILAINANTTDSITTLVAEHVRANIAADVELRAVSGRFGARYISTEASNAIAAHTALDCYAVHGAGADAVLLACFGDPGLFALREVCAVPVVGLAEASMREASARVSRYAIVTGGVRWAPMLARLADSLGYGKGLAGIRTVTRTGAAIAADPEAAYEELARECRAARHEQGAELVILGGAGLAGIAARIADRVDLPLIDSVVSGARAAEALARGAPPAYQRMPPGARTPSIGLDAGLAALLGD